MKVRSLFIVLAASVVLVQIMYWVVALYCPVKVMLGYKGPGCSLARMVLQ